MVATPPASATFNASRRLILLGIAISLALPRFYCAENNITAPSGTVSGLYRFVWGKNRWNMERGRRFTNIACADHQAVFGEGQVIPRFTLRSPMAFLVWQTIGQQWKLKLIGNLFKREAACARPEDSHRDDDHEHSEGDQSIDSWSSKTLEEEIDDEAGKCRGQASPGVNKPNRTSPHTGRK